MTTAQSIILGIVILAIIGIIWYSIYQKRKAELEKAKIDSILSFNQGFDAPKSALENLLNTEFAKSFAKIIPYL